MNEGTKEPCQSLNKQGESQTQSLISALLGLTPGAQAFHALNEQGVAAAPLGDGDSGAVVGMISASDFIHVLQRLRSRSVGPDCAQLALQHPMKAESVAILSH